MSTMFPNQRPMPTPSPFGNGGAPPQQQSPFSQGPISPNAPSLGPPPPLAPRRPPSNAPPAPPQRMAPMGNNMNMNPNMNNMNNNNNNNAVQSPLTRSLPQAPLPFDNSVPGAYVDPSAWTVASNNNGGNNNNNNMNNNVNAGPPGAFGRARARSRSVGSLDRPNPSIFGGPGAGPPSSQFNNPGGSMRAAPGDLARAAGGPPGAAPGGPAKPLKPPKTSKLPVGATSGEAFGTVSPPPMGSAPVGARSDGAFGVVQPVQPGGSMRLPPTQQQQQKQQQQMGGSVRDFPAGGSLGARNFSQPNIGSQPSAMVRGQISPRGAQPQQQQQPQQLVSGTDQPVERCVCPKCGKLFYFRSDVETHMRLRHT